MLGRDPGRHPGNSQPKIVEARDRLVARHDVSLIASGCARAKRKSENVGNSPVSSLRLASRDEGARIWSLTGAGKRAERWGAVQTLRFRESSLTPKREESWQGLRDSNTRPAVLETAALTS